MRNLVADVYGQESPAAMALTVAADAIWRVLGKMQEQAAQDWPARRADDFYR